MAFNKVLHSSITEDRVCEGVRQSTFGLESVGFCILCGEEASGCEPDAADYPCEACGASAVYGAEEILLHIVA